MRRPIVFGLIVFVTLALALVDLCAGEVWIPPVEALAALRDPSAPQAFLVYELRAGHVAGALVVGLCLGMSGAISQSLLRNPLASPDIVGVTAGASCAAVAALLGAGAGSFVPGAAGSSVAVAACLGGVLAGLLVVALAWNGGVDARRVILVGLGVNAGLTALSSWLLARADLPDIATATVWLTGSLSAASLALVTPAAWGTVLLLVLSVLTARTLDLLRFDELTARSLGVRVPLAQLVQALVCLAAASLACSVAGPVAFVAFCAPQVAAVLLRTAGPPVLGGAAVGALLTVGADLAARTLFPYAVPVGLVTSFCGAPVLLWLLLRISKTATP
ncbi:FecCD family ABC transporter permease [Gephyromycinifex aptenodytis]|uniref:FecCD family ABC transporter permease n=1 Tax=Gephyromycinifex aptenodytis TaxID=2716227 RepID=UPI0014450B7A|nr:iron ABC transporter permease [Gephyromycinifex aptenodytis]